MCNLFIVERLTKTGEILVTLASQIASFSRDYVWDFPQHPMFERGNLRLEDTLSNLEAQWQNDSRLEESQWEEILDTFT